MKTIEAYCLIRDYNGFRAVDQVSFAVKPGEIFGFLGPNGAGKTTTIKMLTGLLSPTAGYAKVAGYDVVNQRDELHSHIGVVFEDQNIYERLSARENLMFVARLYGVDKVRVEQVLEMVGLVERAKERVQKYSLGMKQQLSLARALLPSPEIVFLDEPTKYLDPRMARDIYRVISELTNQGVTIFLATNSAKEAGRLAKRVAILKQGAIVALDTTSNLTATHESVETSLEGVFTALTEKGLT
jgi:ABC-2 type transport system ATP-binding protein